MARRPVLSALAVAVLVGCEPTPQPVELTRQQLEFESIEEYDGFFDGCVETLRLYGFELDRIDRREGVITTFPVTSEHFFEFWRRDVDTRHDWFEASLLPLRRKVEVNLDRPEGGISGTLVVKVTRERLSAPDRQYNTSGAAFLVFSQGLPATTGKPTVPSRDEYWIADGRDGAMEARLVREMSGRPVVTDAERAPPVADESPESPATEAP